VLRCAYFNKLRGALQVYNKIISHFGSHANLARALGVSRVAVTLWRKEGIPAQRAIEIEKITGGKFKAVDIQGVKDGE
jgi:DNA-binding transcriptional regulator YdaS (Cro superfamily)